MNLPNFLTLSRIAVIPILVALFYVAGPGARWVAAGLFALACVTDFFDGYLARAHNQSTQFGRLLDPIADKLLVGAMLFMLVATGRVTGPSVIAALVILSREILVSGLREYLSGLRVDLPVSRLAKWKTALQLAAIAVLLVGDAGPGGAMWLLAGHAGLWAAAAITAMTGYDYWRIGIARMSADADRPSATEA